jgi:hypothetical protein
MAHRNEIPFTHIPSSAPSFTVSLTTVASVTVLQSTAVNRIWAGGANRAVRVSSNSSKDGYVVFGSSLTAAESSTNAMLHLSGTVEVFYVSPSMTYIGLYTPTTTAETTINVTLGYGG